MSNNQADYTKNLTDLFEKDDKSFKSLVASVKEARKATESLLARVKEKKDEIIAARMEREAQAALELEMARKAEAEKAKAEAAALAKEQALQQAEEEEPVQPQEEAEEVVAEPEVQEPVQEAPQEEEAKPQPEAAPTIFIPADSPINREQDRLKAYRAQNVQEPRKFVPAPAKPKVPAKPAHSERIQPAAGTTYVPPSQGGRNQRGNQRGQQNNKNFDRDGEDKRRRTRREIPEDVSEAELARRFKQRNKNAKGAEPVASIKIEHAVVSVDPVPLKMLAEKIGRPANELVKKLLMLGEFKTINDSVDFEQAELIAIDYGVTLELKLEETMEDKLSAYIEKTREGSNANMVKRAPIVTIMGHVDHGKTSLLDYIRSTNVAGGEAGGITQHIGAYTIRLAGEKITFIDTPGHEAFTTMRARGAMVTDIAVIVVAADDSIMPQTVESINHAKAAKVPIIVAINKIDKQGANIDRVKNDLAKHDLLIEEWGGDTICVPVSAKTGEGVDNLLKQILLVAEVNELKANPRLPASGTILEARLDKNIGPVATILVQEGTLKVADFVVAGSITGKIRMMTDDKGNSIKQAGPSIPVSVLGFDSVPNAGDQCVVVEEKFARSVAEERKIKERIERLNRTGNNLENIFKEMTEGKMKELNLIVKADVQGSVEALVSEVKKLSNEEVKVNVIHSGVGAVTENDVLLAQTSSAIIIAFNVRPDANAKVAAAREQVEIRTYRIIYEVIDEINLALKGMLAPKYRENVLGHAEVRAIYHISSVGTIAGCYVTDGKIERNSGVRLLRDNVVVYEGKLQSLRRVKDDVKEVSQGYECGVGLERYNDIKEGDVIESFVMEQIEV